MNSASLVARFPAWPIDWRLGHARATLLRSAPLVVSVIIGCCIALQSVMIVRQWHTTDREVTSDSAVRQMSQMREAKRPVNAETIAAAHLFGEFKEADTEHLPASRAPLTLTGTIALADPSAGLAFIGNTAASTQLLRVGDRIGDARVRSIYNDRVVLDRGGNLEVLSLPKQWSGTGAATIVARTSEESAPRMATPYSETVRLTPAFNKKREQIGYRMFPVDGSKGMDKFLDAGLQPGDLLTAIEGSSVTDPAVADALLKTLSNGDHANVTITRGGKQLQLALKGP